MPSSVAVLPSLFAHVIGPSDIVAPVRHPFKPPCWHQIELSALVAKVCLVFLNNLPLVLWDCGREARECGQAVGNASALSTGCPHGPQGSGRSGGLVHNSTGTPSASQCLGPGSLVQDPRYRLSQGNRTRSRPPCRDLVMPPKVRRGIRGTPINACEPVPFRYRAPSAGRRKCDGRILRTAPTRAGRNHRGEKPS